MDLPKVLRIQQPDSRSSISIELGIDGDLDVFKGHFPGKPIVPGIVLIHWVLQLVKLHLQPISPLAIQHIEGLKFQRVIAPPAEVRLDLEFSSTALNFTYSSEAGRHASGKIALAL